MIGSRLRSADDERGESLVELLITIMVLGITIPAIMGAVLLSISVSTQDRRQVQAQAALSTWAETIARENTDARYTACPNLAYYSTSPFSPPAPPAGFTTTVTGITYWNGSTTFDAPCTADNGVRRLQLQVAVRGGLFRDFVVSQSIVLRKPCPSC